MVVFCIHGCPDGSNLKIKRMVSRCISIDFGITFILSVICTVYCPPLLVWPPSSSFLTVFCSVELLTFFDLCLAGRLCRGRK